MVPRICATARGEKREDHHLAGERLGGRDSDLRSDVYIAARIGLARYRRSHHVAERPKDKRTLLLGNLYGGKRVGGLPLCEIGYHDIIGCKHRIRIAELAGILHHHRNAAHVLDKIAAKQSGMP